MNVLHTLLDRFNTRLENHCLPFPEEPPEKPPDSLFGFIAHYALPFRQLILVSAAFSIAISLIEIYLFSFVGNLVDWLTASDREHFWDTYRFQLILVGALVLIILPTLKFLYESIVHQGLLGNFAMRTRWQAHRYLLRQSVEFFQNDFAGRIATKMMQTSLGLRDAVIRTTEVLLYVAVYFTGAVVLFATSDLRLTAPMLLWLTGYLIALRYFIPRMQVISMEQANARSMVTGRVVDSYTNMVTVKMFAHSHAEDDYAREGMSEFLDTVYRQMRLSALLTAVLNWLNAGLLFLVGTTSLLLWHQDAVSVGAIAFAMGLVLRLQGMSQWILWEVAGLFENIGVVQDGIEVISREIAVTDRPDAGRLQVTGGTIRFRHVIFNYGKDRDTDGKIITNFSLDVHSREKVGLVGRSGSGKSTLVNLLLRFYDAESGVIEIDGQDIAGVTQESLRANIAMVTQDPSLLHRSVLDNIRYGSPDADRDMIMEAAKKARAHEFIVELEDLHGRRGYEAHVGERGIKLSGGQRQRIAIARALIKNTPILLLDEATSALDSEVEAAIQESFRNVMEGKTVIAIAHRLSTIAEMDRLVIMDRGRIIESGSHRELVKTGGLYAELWSRQSGGFLV